MQTDQDVVNVDGQTCSNYEKPEQRKNTARAVYRANAGLGRG